MWTLEINNVTIPLPNEADAFIVSKKDGGLISTDIDLYLNDTQMVALGISGVLEEENGYRYKREIIKGALYNLQKIEKALDCDVTVNKFSLTDRVVNITIESKGVDDIQVCDIYEDIVRMGLMQRELWGLTPFRHDNNQKELFSGYRIGNIDYGCCPPPVVMRDRFQEFLTHYFIGKAVPDLNDFNYLNIIPNEIELNGDIKMRRGCVRWAADVSEGRWTASQSFVVKGDYAGLQNDVWKSDIKGVWNSDIGALDITYSMTIESMTKRGCRKTRLYFYPYFSANSTFTFTLSGFNQRCAVVLYIDNTYYTAYGDVMSDVIFTHTGISASNQNLWSNYIEVVPIDAYIPLSFSTTIDGSVVSYSTNGLVRIDFQQHWDDDYDALVKLVGYDGDTEFRFNGHGYLTQGDGFEGEAITKHFDSRAWGASIYSDYDGDIDISGFTNQGYNEDLYNITYNNWVPLMYVDPMNCIRAKIYDVVRNMGYMNSVFFFENDNEIGWNTDLDFDDIEEIKEYFKGEMFFDEDIRSIGIGYQSGNLGVGDSDNFTIYRNYDLINTRLNTRDWNYSPYNLATIPAYNILVNVILNDDGTYPDDATNKEMSVTLFQHYKRHYTRNVQGKVFDSYQIDGKGYAFYRTASGDDNDYNHIEQSMIDSLITKTKEVITANINIVGWVEYEFVIFQNRTWRVLQQEMNSNGVNELTLLLFY